MSPLNNTLVAEAGASSRGVPAAGAPAVGLQHTNTIRAPAATLEPLWVRRLLMLAAFLFLGLFLFVPLRSEEHTSELQSLMRISYAVFCLKKKNHTNQHALPTPQHT